MKSNRLTSLLEAIEPYSSRRASHRALALQLARSPGIADRDALPVHLTASVFVVDQPAGRVLLAWHPKFERWLQPGGHCDGETDLRQVARRELEEETGLVDVGLESVPFDVDIHPGEPGGLPHMHVDVRFVGVAAVGAAKQSPISPEGLELRWFEPDELEDPYIREAVRAAVDRAA